MGKTGLFARMRILPSYAEFCRKYHAFLASKMPATAQKAASASCPKSQLGETPQLTPRQVKVLCRLLREAHFLKHPQGFSEFSGFSTFNECLPNAFGVFQRTFNNAITDNSFEVFALQFG